MDKPHSVLLVDDNSENLNVLKKMLELMNYQVTTSENGLDSLFKISSFNFDLILLDINLPDLDGFEVLKQVREQYTLTELPVIMVTASTKNSDIVDSLSLGANDYITKPFDFSVIQSRISTQLTLKDAEEALRISEERYALASQATRDGLWDYFLSSDRIYVSSNWNSIVGLDPENNDISVGEYQNLIHPADLESFKRELNRLINGKQTRMEIEHRMKFSDENYRWVITTAIPVSDKNHEVLRLIGSVSDITKNKLYSSFAHLPNSVLILDRIEQILKQMKSGHVKKACIFFIDMDNFRYINQAYGILEGDSILLQIVERLMAIEGQNETLAHAGRDEFILLLEDYGEFSDIRHRIDDYEKVFSLPFQSKKNDEIKLTASAGIVDITDKYENAKKVLQDAESAMNIAKKDKLQRFHFFRDDFYQAVISRLESEKKLRRAIKDGELKLYYQPQISVESHKLIGFEALIRWNDPENGLVMPNKFIPLAEESGLIIEIEEWTLEEACRQLNVWKDQGYSLKRVAVNLSPVHFKDRKLLGFMEEVISKYEIDPALLELEITETKVMDNPEENIRMMHRLKDLGISFSIDDFGTGYSSLSMLRKFPLSTLKIDRSFVMDIHKNQEALSIVLAIIAMAQSMHFSTIAEGVEEVEQLSILRSAGCENYQGFLTSKAVPAAEVPNFLQQY